MIGEIEVKREPESIEERAKIRSVKTCWNCKHVKEGDVTFLKCTHPERVRLRELDDQSRPGVLNLILYSLFPDPCGICGFWASAEGWEKDFEETNGETK